MEADFEQRIRLLFKEAYQRKVGIALSFLVICLLVTGVGVAWPKSYDSSTTLLIQEKNITERGENSRSGRPDTGAKVNTVRQVLSRRALLEPVLREGGWIDDATPPAQLEEHLEGFQKRMTVTSTAPNLIRISFKDGNARRAYETTRRLGELVIEEMQSSRIGESRAAYGFINSQVQVYRQQLEEKQEQLAALREENPLARPGAEEQAARKVSELQDRVENLKQGIQEAQVTERTLVAQLSGEADMTVLGQFPDPRGEKLADLRERLAELRVNYTESYPDVVRLRQQIAELEAEDDGGAGSESMSPEARERLMAQRARDNPLLQGLQQQLYETRAQVQRLEARLADNRQRLEEAREREEQARSVRDEVDRLTRDYTVDQEVFQDLQRRREDARVAVSLDSEQQPFTLRVAEPAYMPHQPDGPRLLQFAAGGVVAGASVPLSLLFLFLVVDPRVRTGSSLPEPCARRLLEVIPHVSTRRERVLDGVKLALTLLIVMLGIGGVLGILTLRYLGQI